MVVYCSKLLILHNCDSEKINEVTRVEDFVVSGTSGHNECNIFDSTRCFTK